MQTENQVCFASIVNIGICAILGAWGGGGDGVVKTFHVSDSQFRISN